MTKTFEIYGREIEFAIVTAIWDGAPEEGRREAIKIHDTTDKYNDGDMVIFEATMPEDEVDARNLLSETGETNYETLDTVECV